MSAMTEYYIWLLQLMGAANPKTYGLIRHYGSAKLAYEAIALDRDLGLLSDTERKKLSTVTLENAERIAEECEKHKIKTVLLGDEDYPYRLANIYNPPVMLFYKGSIKGLNDEICISAVGARSATEYTAKVTRRTCMDLSKLGTVLVSGMANGVDHLVHQSAIDAGGRTIGVLACGIEIDYPKGSIPTRERMYELGGACISELLPYTQTSRAYFHARNRIISGLSLGTIVFQAGMGSGSLITADHALQQGRDLFCVPPWNVFSSECCGVVKYLRDGAVPLFNYLDVVNYYYDVYEGKIGNIEQKYNVAPEKHFIFDKKDTENGKEKALPKQNAKKSVEEEGTARKTANLTAGRSAEERFDFEAHGPEYKIIYDYLKKNGKRQLEEITAECGISPDDISLYLLELEMAEVIEGFPGAYYEVIA